MTGIGFAVSAGATHNKIKYTRPQVLQPQINDKVTGWRPDKIILSRAGDSQYRTLDVNTFLKRGIPQLKK